MGGDRSWLNHLAYGLRLTVGWLGAGWLSFVLLRQGYWNSRVLWRCHTQLLIAGVPTAPHPPGVIRTALRHYWQLLRAMPVLADDEAVTWQQRLRALHDEVQEISDRFPGDPKLLQDPDARALQFEFLQRFFRTRLGIELPPPGDAFARYLPGVDGLRAFFDFCASRGRLTSREEVEDAVGEFAREVQEYRVHYRRNPPKRHFAGQGPVRTSFWHRVGRLLRPARLLAQIYWAKNHAERVTQGLPVPPWAAKLVANGLVPPRELLRHRLRSVLVYETCLQALRSLAKQCARLGVSADPSSRAPEAARVARPIQEAVEDLRQVARRFAA